MSKKFVSIDRNQPMLLPPDLRDWVPEDELVHFVIEAVERVNLHAFKVNLRGSGSAQYPPHMMLSLLIYCYANGIFSSRRIERATYRDVFVRYLTADTHPDHDTIAKFRRENFEAVATCFLQVLQLARELKVLKVGTVSVDGTTMKANASRNRNVRYDRADQLREQLELDVRELLEKAEQSDQCDERDGQSLPEQIAKRQKLKEQLDEACKRIEQQAKKKAQGEQGEYERKVKAREQRKGSAKGCKIKKPNPTPEPGARTNLTDPDSRLMRHNKNTACEQAYNAQATVDADGSQLVLSAHISQLGTDYEELAPAIEGIPKLIGRPQTVLADNGYFSEKQLRPFLEPQEGKAQMEVLVSVHSEAKQVHGKYDLSPKQKQNPPKTESALVRAMKEKMAQEESKAKYRLRKQSVEPVFGIIKTWMGFKQFLLRGKEKVSGEWQLVTLAYNMKRLHNMRCASKEAISTV